MGPPLGTALNKEPSMHNTHKYLALAALSLILFACAKHPAHSEERGTQSTRTSTSTSTSGTKSGTSTRVQTQTAPRDTILRDTTRVLGTPGSPTGAESRGMPGEKPIPRK
jgi:hypothetical protein